MINDNKENKNDIALTIDVGEEIKDMFQVYCSAYSNLCKVEYIIVS